MFQHVGVGHNTVTLPKSISSGSSLPQIRARFSLIQARCAPPQVHLWLRNKGPKMRFHAWFTLTFAVYSARGDSRLHATRFPEKNPTVFNIGGVLSSNDSVQYFSQTIAVCAMGCCFLFQFLVVWFACSMSTSISSMFRRGLLIMIPPYSWIPTLSGLR